MRRKPFFTFLGIMVSAVLLNNACKNERTLSEFTVEIENNDENVSEQFDSISNIPDMSSLVRMTNQFLGILTRYMLITTRYI